MKLPEATHCPNCERLGRRLAQQDADIATLKAQLAEAIARITQLEQQLAAAQGFLHLLHAAVERRRLGQTARFQSSVRNAPCHIHGEHPGPQDTATLHRARIH
jgi:septal ring factor EnvC (AmiA/AmiB activator)